MKYTRFTNIITIETTICTDVVTSPANVPRIIEACGKEAFEFEDNSLLVTIPFNRINISETSNDTSISDEKNSQNLIVNDDNQNSQETAKRLPRDYQETTKTLPRDYQEKGKILLIQ